MIAKLVQAIKHLPGQHSQASHGKGGSSTGAILNSNEVKSSIAALANEVLDSWQPDEEGFDEEFGYGGACDTINGCIQDVLTDKLPAGVDLYEGGQGGDDHAWSIVHDPQANKAWGVDIPPNVYETGGGYSWSKIPDAKVTARDVEIFEIPNFEPYE